MTIRPGEAWGSEVPRPPVIRVAHGDAELAALISDDPAGDYAVDVGDLHRTVGTPPGGGTTVHRLPIDVLDVVVDGSRHLAVAHVVIRRGWWRGPLVFAGNVGHLGAWDVAPRAHPNDGRFDLVQVAAGMRFRDRWEARRRLPTGTHLPHPAISVRTAREFTWADPAGAHVRVDGVDLGVRHEVTVRVVPDAASLLV